MGEFSTLGFYIADFLLTSSAETMIFGLFKGIVDLCLPGLRVPKAEVFLDEGSCSCLFEDFPSVLPNMLSSSLLCLYRTGDFLE